MIFNCDACQRETWEVREQCVNICCFFSQSYLIESHFTIISVQGLENICCSDQKFRWIAFSVLFFLAAPVRCLLWLQIYSLRHNSLPNKWEGGQVNSRKFLSHSWKSILCWLLLACILLQVLVSFYTVFAICVVISSHTMLMWADLGDFTVSP